MNIFFSTSFKVHSRMTGSWKHPVVENVFIINYVAFLVYKSTTNEFLFIYLTTENLFHSSRMCNFVVFISLIFWWNQRNFTEIVHPTVVLTLDIYLISLRCAFLQSLFKQFTNTSLTSHRICFINFYHFDAVFLSVKFFTNCCWSLCGEHQKISTEQLSLSFEIFSFVSNRVSTIFSFELH